MTMQRRDSFILDDQNFALWLGEGEGFFNPDEHGVQRKYRSSGCHRGYYATYHLQNNCLELLRLVVGRGLKDILPFNGIEPRQLGRDEPGYSEVGYADIGLKIPFTGGLMIVREWTDPREGIGPELLWRFVHVKELIFENGNLVALFDRSQQMAELRAKFLEEETDARLVFPEIRSPEIMEIYSQSVDEFYSRMKIELDLCLKLDYHRDDST